MRRLAVPLLALALGLSACGDGPCQELGERICRCQPGLGEDACTTLVEDQLSDRDPGEGLCEDVLRSCNAPSGGDLCEYLLTDCGKIQCGLAQQTTPPTTCPPEPSP